MELTTIAIGGLVTLISLLSTAFISVGNRRGWHQIDMKWHTRLAALTIILALIHGTAGLLKVLGYI